MQLNQKVNQLNAMAIFTGSSTESKSESTQRDGESRKMCTIKQPRMVSSIYSESDPATGDTLGGFLLRGFGKCFELLGSVWETSPRLGDFRWTSRSDYLDLSEPPISHECILIISIDFLDSQTDASKTKAFSTPTFQIPPLDIIFGMGSSDLRIILY